MDRKGGEWTEGEIQAYAEAEVNGRDPIEGKMRGEANEDSERQQEEPRAWGKEFEPVLILHLDEETRERLKEATKASGMTKEQLGQEGLAMRLHFASKGFEEKMQEAIAGWEGEGGAVRNTIWPEKTGGAEGKKEDIEKQLEETNGERQYASEFKDYSPSEGDGVVTLGRQIEVLRMYANKHSTSSMSEGYMAGAIYALLGVLEREVKKGKRLGVQLADAEEQLGGCAESLVFWQEQSDRLEQAAAEAGSRITRDEEVEMPRLERRVRELEGEKSTKEEGTKA